MFSICSSWIYLNLLLSYTLITQVSGYKKVLNYMKRVAQEQRYKRSLTREEVNQWCLLFSLCVPVQHVNYVASHMPRINNKIKLES
jgi:hypothetical protein